jgi:hypothetical protein
MLLDRHEVQPRAARRVAPPRLPGGEEIDACAEAVALPWWVPGVALFD